MLTHKKLSLARMLRLLPLTGLTLMGSAYLHADIVADFSGGEGTSNPSTQFVGTSGGGWTTAWETYAEEATLTPTVTNANPIVGSNNYLQATITSNAVVKQHRSSINRGYDVGELPSVYTISFTIRADSLDGFGSNDFIGFFGSQGAITGTTSSSSQTWGILISSSSAISLRNGDVSGNSSINTGLNFVESGVYTFDITIDSAARRWGASITSTEGNFTSDDNLEFRSGTNVSQHVMFNTLMNKDDSPNETWSYSVSGLTIVPEPSSSALLLLIGTTAIIPFLRRRFRARR